MSISASLQIKMNSNFSCSYMAMSTLTYMYILGFSVRFFSASLFRLGILWDKNHIKIFCSEIWVKKIFGWPTFKIMCSTPPTFGVKLKTRWAITGWQPLVLAYNQMAYKLVLTSVSSSDGDIFPIVFNLSRYVNKHEVCHRQFLFLIGRFLKNLLWNCLANWTETW